MSIANLCYKESIYSTLYKALLEAGKRQLTGDTIRGTGSEEVKELKVVKRAVEESLLKDRMLKKSWRAGDGD